MLLHLHYYPPPSLHAEILEVNEANFPDAAIRAYLTSTYCTSTSGSSFFDKGATTLKDGKYFVDTEKVIQLYYLTILPDYYSKVEDLRCLKLFPNFKSNGGTFDIKLFCYGTKERNVRIDISGTKVTAIKCAKPSNVKNIKSIVADNCDLKTIDIENCNNLAILSLNGSTTNLTTCTLKECHALEYLDLSQATKLPKLTISNATVTGKLRALKLPADMPEMHNVTIERTELEHLDLSGIHNDVISKTGNAGTINVNMNSRLHNLDIRHIIDVPTVYFSGCAMTYMQFIHDGQKIYQTFTKTSSHTRHVGYLPDGKFDITEGLYDNVYSHPMMKFSNVSGGKISGKYFVFNDGATVGKYTMTVPCVNGTANSMKNSTMTVTLYRDMTPHEFYVVGENIGTADNEFDEAYKLEYKGYDTWELPGVRLQGDFFIKEKGGTELVFGGHDVERAYREPIEAVALADNGDGSYVPTRDYVYTPNATAHYYAKRNTSVPFSTYDHDNNKLQSLNNTNLTFKYTTANPDHAANKTENQIGHLYLTGGTVTGIESVGSSSDAAENSDAPVEYYNLQGLRVNADNLTPGIYIRRQGSVATKIAVR